MVLPGQGLPSHRPVPEAPSAYIAGFAPACRPLTTATPTPAAETPTAPAAAADAQRPSSRGRRPPRPGQGQPQAQAKGQRPNPAARPHHPLLDQLATHFPALFGARFRPLKVGTYDDILARHPQAYEAEALKAALGEHARSTRYLEAVANGDARHDLDGQPVEPVAPEHRLHAIMAVYRRRQARAPEAQRQWAVDRVAAAITASGLERADYLERIRTQDPQTLALVDEAFEALRERTAKREALRRAYAASGKSPAEFAAMYGLDEKTVKQALAD